MDEIARGIAMASLILQSSLLRSLVANGAMTRAQALNVIEKALAASHGKGSSKEEQDVALVTAETLQGVREGLADVDLIFWQEQRYLHPMLSISLRRYHPDLASWVRRISSTESHLPAARTNQGARDHR